MKTLLVDDNNSEHPNPAPPFAVVVNDDPTQLKVLCGLVRKAGLQPRAFTDAETALTDMSACAETEIEEFGIFPRLVVTDLYMPGIDGWRFCRLLRSPEYAAFNKIPILVISATFAGDEADRIADDLGAEAFLPSPVDGRRFVEQVRAILSSKRVRPLPRVLIVEDSRTLADIIKKAFAVHGYQADTACTARAAVDAFAITAYDVAVLDYHLPDGMGDALLDTFRAHRPDCVCLMMTTDTGPELALNWMKRGAAAYLKKPFQPDYLLELCARARRERALLRVQDLIELRTRELRESEEQLRAFMENAPDGVYLNDLAGNFLYVNRKTEEISGYRREDLIGKNMMALNLLPPGELAKAAELLEKNIRGQFTGPDELTFTRKNGSHVTVEINTSLVRRHGKPVVIGFVRDITERKRLESALEKRLVALIRPLDQPEGITFEELFDPTAIQRIQDEFAAATGVASIITQPDGTPITRPSNFCRLCEDIIRCTEAGRHNCYRSDALLGRHHPDGPIIQPCLSGGLWDAGASITVGDRHIANWLIGQVRDETQSEEKMREYARAIGADEVAAIEAFRKVPAMSLERFKQVAQALFTLANQLSTTAYQNIQQARFINERKLAEAELLREQLLMKTLLDSLPGIFYLYSYPELRLVRWNKNHETLLGFGPGEIKDRPILEWHLPEAKEAVLEAVEMVMEKGQNMIESPLLTKDGRLIPFILTGVKLEVSGRIYLMGVGTDITERKRAEAEKTVLEGQLQQSRKMESVGRLAGGVAHDFNNMLGAILGHAELAIEQVDPAQRIFSNLYQIQKAARRSADLTRQLLAFARQQTVAPKVMDLNETVGGMLNMLERLIGENIDLTWKPDADLWAVKLDPSQIDQVLANLCVNARDAISGIGKITIETGNSTFDADYCAAHAGFAPGQYVMLAVSDDGCGLDKETMACIFEPFFTTKEMGKGTGLGLATVYGIVKQNNGFINVYSEPGQGTTFKIYLPRHAGKIEQTWKEALVKPDARGHETILLVEDEPAILELITMMLERQGYTILVAPTPGKAIRLAREHSGEIHLLMTDVVMPEMNGRDLAKNLLSLHPHLKRLFMSGYTANVIAHHGVLDEGVYFIQKPFSISELAAKVREVLSGDILSIS
jgi:PAS domain S-box-containing protein